MNVRTATAPKAKPFMKTYRPPEEAGYSADLLARKELYRSRDWHRVKARLKRKHGGKPRCAACNAPANTLDHLLGHDDDQARLAASALSLTAAARWRDRFFVGPFIWLCHSDHSRKTRAEMDGKLLDWLRCWVKTGL